MLRGVEFSIWNASSIIKSSVCEVTEKKVIDKGEPVKNGLRDPRMGPFSGRCVTCNLFKGACPGHFGHLTLCEHVYHISWVNTVLHWLKCICHHCGSLLMKELVTPPDIPQNRRLYYYIKRLHSRCPHCEKKQPKFTFCKENCTMLRDGALYPTADVLDHLNRVAESDIMGMDMSHPKHMLIQVLPVPGTNVRPPIINDGVIRGEDDLTYRLIQILRANDRLERIKRQNRPAHVIANAREGLQNAVTGYFNHAKLSGPRKRSSTREYASLASKLTKKEGRIRGNLMGKRCDYTARTVITGDPYLGMHEVGVPKSVAEKLTVPVKVTDYNCHTLQELLKQDGSPIKFVIRPNGSRVDLTFVKSRSIQLDVGYTVERSLQDGDIVLFNRQPSLHKMSLMAHEVRVLPYSTFRMNLSCTTPYNADCK